MTDSQFTPLAPASTVPAHSRPVGLLGRILLLVLSPLLLAGSVGGLLLVRLADEQAQEAVLEAQTLGDLRSFELSRRLGDFRALARLLASSAGSQGRDLTALQARASAVRGTGLGLVELLWVDASGQIQDGLTAPAPRSPLAAEALAAIAAQGGTALFAMAQGAQFYVAMRMDLADAADAAVAGKSRQMIAIFDASRPLGSALSVSGTPVQGVMLLDAQRRVMTSSLAGEAGAQRGAAGASSVAVTPGLPVVEALRQRGIRAAWGDEAQAHPWRAWESEVGGTAWRLVVLQSNASLTGTASRTMGIAVAVLSLALLLAAASAVLLYRWVVQPLRAMVAAHGQLAKGDRRTRLPESARDEFGDLARSFNDMAETLQNTEQGFQAVFEALPHPLLLLDLTSGEMLKANPAACRFFDLPRERLVGRRLEQLWPQGLAPQHEALWMRVRASERLEGIEVPLPRGSGQPGSQLIYSTPLRLSGHPLALVLSVDVTDLHQAQLALQESRRRAQVLFDRSPIPLIVFGDQPPHVVQELNAAAETQLALRRDAILGQPLFATGLWNSSDACEADLASALSGDAIERQMRVAGRVEAPCLLSATRVDSAGQPVLLLALQDLSETRRTQQELQQALLHVQRQEQMAESEQRLQAVMRATGEGIWDWDIPSGTLFNNGRWCEMFGFATDDTRHALDDFMKLIHPEDAQSVGAAIQQSLATGEPYYHQHRMTRADGREIWVLDRGAVVERNEAGEPLRMVGSVSDITAVKQAELELVRAKAAAEAAHARSEHTLAELQRTQQELVRAEKLSSLGALVAGVAHELNTPIGNALIVANTLSDHQKRFKSALQAGVRRSDLDAFLADVAQSSEVVERNLFRAADLVSSFKQVAVDQSGEQRRRFMLGDVVHEVVVTMGPTMRKAGATIAVVAPDMFELDSWPGPLSRVLMNLVNNALVHGFEGQPGGRIEISYERLGDEQVRVCVADDGRGMPPEVLNKVFDPFFTTRLGQGGSGLGMHIVYTLVRDLLGGRISIDSAPGAGTRITMELPLRAPSNQALTTAVTTDALPESGDDLPLPGTP